MLKQRLVGFIVLAALAVIFWPIVFVSPVPEADLMLPVFEMPERPSLKMSDRREPELEIVDRTRLPALERADQPSDEPVDAVKVDPSVSLIQADTEPKNQVAAGQRAEFDEQGLPISWTLQVATFSTESRAEEIAAELRAKGHKAYVSPVTISARALFRVRIGPNLQRQRLLDIQPGIDAYYGVDSKIIKFEV